MTAFSTAKQFVPTTKWFESTPQEFVTTLKEFGSIPKGFVSAAQRPSRFSDLDSQLFISVRKPQSSSVAPSADSLASVYYSPTPKECLLPAQKFVRRKNFNIINRKMFFISGNDYGTSGGRNFIERKIVRIRKHWI